MKIQMEQARTGIMVNINHRIIIKIWLKDSWYKMYNADIVSVRKTCMICKNTVIGMILFREDDEPLYSDCKNSLLDVAEYNRMLLNPICYNCNAILQCKTDDEIKRKIKDNLDTNTRHKMVLYNHIELDWDEEIEAGMNWIFNYFFI